MKNSLTSAARIALALFLCALGPIAQAQTLTATVSGSAQTVAVANAANTSYGCVAVSTSIPLILDYAVPSGGTFDSWKVEGDFTLITGYPATPTTPSTRIYPSGYGKIRVTVGYYIVTGTGTGTVPCGTGTVTYTYDIRSLITKVYDINKTFPTWPTNLGGAANSSPLTIGGPACVSAGASVVYSIYPVVSDKNQIAKNIGSDGYKWAVYSNAAPTVPLALTYPSGDGSSITFTAPIDGYRVRLVVGNCNGAVGLSQSAGVGAAEKILDVVASPALPSVSGFPSCLATSAASLGFTLNGLTPTKQYSIQSALGTPQIAGVTISAAGVFTANLASHAVTMNINGNAGDVFVSSIGGCANTQTLRLSLTRTLSSVVNGLTGVAPIIMPNPVPCQAAVAPGIMPAVFTLTLNNAPGSTLGYDWTVPSGWLVALGTGTQTNATTINTPQPTISIQRPMGSNVGGTVRANVTGCLATASFVERIVNVTGLPGTCMPSNYSLNRTFSGSPATPVPDGFSISNTGGCTLPFGTDIYKWERMDTVPVIVKYTSGPSVGFGHLAPYLQSDVRVTVTGTGTSCFYLQLSNTNMRPAPTGGGKTPAVAAAVARLNQQLSVYPNPASQTVQVDLGAGARATLTLHDALGRVVSQSALKEGHAALDVKTLPEGQYWLRVDCDGSTLHRLVQVKH